MELGSEVHREKEQEKKNEFTGEMQDGDRNEWNCPENYISTDKHPSESILKWTVR